MIEEDRHSSITPSERDALLIAEGAHPHIADCLGAHCVVGPTGPGVRFAVWAPNAESVAVVGDFNAWDGQEHVMRRLSGGAIWTLFIPGIAAGARYQYAVRGPDGRQLPLKADPYARQTEKPPATASIVSEPQSFTWTDQAWMAGRALRQTQDAPMSIYEVHLASWRTTSPDSNQWDDIGSALVDYAADMGYTHIELLPIAEHPFGGSWGYQPLGMYAPSARYGGPRDFARFVDRCHGAGLGLILDWVPGHFPKDEHGLVGFDGTPLYEYADPRRGQHPDWGSLIYDLGRDEVCNFLLGSALEWLRRYHVDGLRVDAVASMLYRDYSRAPGEWLPNIHGGRENLESLRFLRRLNTVVKTECPGAIMIAEESSAWQGVTAEIGKGGLGFDYKWNMGWMHDTLQYMRRDPTHRGDHHNEMTFGMAYAYSEHFILSLSHDEVADGRGALLEKMPGNTWQRFANLRAYLGFMWAHPGKKLLFMGGDMGQGREWDHDGQLDWACLDDIPPTWAVDVPGRAAFEMPSPKTNPHMGLQRLVRDLNALYRSIPALQADTVPDAFEWLVGDDTHNSVFAFMRSHLDSQAIIISNMKPTLHQDYRMGLPHAGHWAVALDTDDATYGGAGVRNAMRVSTEATSWHGQPQSLSLVLPPLSTLVLLPDHES